jgi:hypothetical protein
MKKLLFLLLLLTLFAFDLADNRSIYEVPLQADAVFASDLDLDGDLDIVIKHSINLQTGWGGIYMLQNDGYGHFEYLNSAFDTAIASTIYSDTVISKIYPDIIYHSKDSIVFLSRDGDDYFKIQYYIGGGSKVNDFALGDVDNNGFLDIVFLSSQEYYWGIIYNNGDTTFSEPVYFDTEDPPNSIVCEDLNHDSRDDVVVIGGSLIGQVWLSTEDGFEELFLLHGGSTIRVADLDKDGENDILSSFDLGFLTHVYVYKNLGNTVFDTVNDFYVPDGSSDFLITDFNNDSLPDVIFLTYDTDGIGYVIFYNQGNFQFGEGQIYTLTNYGEARRYMYCADMDGNGYTDILITRQVFVDSKPSYLEILFNDGNGNFVENPLTAVETHPDSYRDQTLNLSCYPNPFKDRTNIEFTLDKESRTDVSIYSLNGQKIKTLNNKLLQAGKYTHTWDGTDKNGKEVNSGIYLAVLQMNERPLQTIKLFKE